MLLPPMQWMERAIRISSVTQESNDEIVSFMTTLLKECGLKIHEQAVVENGQSHRNLIAFSHALDTPDLLVLNTHLDTVQPGEASDWTKTKNDPFRLTRVRDRMYGLGAADVKLDYLCKLWAIKHTQPWVRPFALVGTYGEERGLVGAMTLFKGTKLKPKYALVGEPSELQLIYAHKGHMVFTMALDLSPGSEPLQQKKWKGVAAHSSTPQLGENAIRKGLDDIRRHGMGIVTLHGGTDANKIADECHADVVPSQNAATARLWALLQLLDALARDLKKIKDSRFSPSFNTLSLNMARTAGGTLRLTFDIRCIPETDTDALKKRLEKIAKEAGVRLAEFGVDLPLRGEKDGRFMKVASRALKESKIPVVKRTKASCTEAAIYNAQGAEAIVFGPGVSIGNVHRPNEHNSVRQLEAATRFYQNLLKIPVEEY